MRLYLGASNSLLNCIIPRVLVVHDKPQKAIETRMKI